MTQMLATELGVVMNHKKVHRIMTKYGMRPTYIKKLGPNYGKQRQIQQAQADHLERHFHQRGWVAYNISTRNDIELVVNTVLKALNSQKKKI